MFPLKNLAWKGLKIPIIKIKWYHDYLFIIGVPAPWKMVFQGWGKLQAKVMIKKKSEFWLSSSAQKVLTHFNKNKIAAIFQTFSHAFSWKNVLFLERKF